MNDPNVSECLAVLYGAAKPYVTAGLIYGGATGLFYAIWPTDREARWLMAIWMAVGMGLWMPLVIFGMDSAFRR